MTTVRPTTGSALASFVGTLGADDASYQHLFFIGQDNDLHELRYDGIWLDNDLTGLAGLPRPASRSPLTGFWGESAADGRSGAYLDHVFFVDSEGQLCEVRNDRTRWRSSPLPVQPTGAQWGHESPLTSLFGGAGRRENVFYVGKDGHVHALWSDGHHWRSEDLTRGAGEALAPSTSPLMSPLTSFRAPTSPAGAGGAQHVFYLGTDRHVRELLCEGASWRSNDLTTASATPARPAMTSRMMSPLTSFFSGADRKENLFYLGTDGHVCQLWSDGRRWRSDDLTQAVPDADAPSLRPMSPLTGFSWSEDDTQHLFYIGENGDLWELWFDGSWHSNDLSRAVRDAEAPALRPMTSLTGHSWSEDRTQHVFYIGEDGDLWELWFDGSWHSNDLTKAA